MTPAQKMGLQIGGFYVISQRPWNAVESIPSLNIVMLILDDTTSSPLFEYRLPRRKDIYVGDSYERLGNIQLYFADPFNPSDNELTLFSLESGWTFEELKEQVEKLKESQKELLKGLDTTA